MDVATFFDSRLPELFAGLSRSELPFPVRYPTSCSPQAWASATPLLFLRSMLRLEPDALTSRVHLAPAIPQRIGELVVKGVAVLDGRLSIEVADGRCQVLDLPPGVTAVDEPAPPTR